MRSWGWRLVSFDPALLLLRAAACCIKKPLEDVQVFDHHCVLFTSLHRAHLFIELAVGWQVGEE
jgi:hypothetical protein